MGSLSEALYRAWENVRLEMSGFRHDLSLVELDSHGGIARGVIVCGNVGCSVEYRLYVHPGGAVEVRGRSYNLSSGGEKWDPATMEHRVGNRCGRFGVME